MILTLIWIAIVILTVIIFTGVKFFPHHISDSKPYFTAQITSWIFSVTGFFLIGMHLAMANISTEIDYKKWDKEYRGLAARIELWYEGAEDDELWENVKDYNLKLKNAQIWANSPWTNWLHERECNKFETFDMPNYERKKD